MTKEQRETAKRRIEELRTKVRTTGVAVGDDASWETTMQAIDELAMIIGWLLDDKTEHAKAVQDELKKG